VKIEVLTSRDDVAALAPEWDALLATTSCNRAFASSTWLLAAGAPPLVVTARRDGVLVALLPLVIDGEEARFASRLADINDAIGIPSAALLDAALEVRPTLRLREVPAESPLRAVARNVEYEPARPILRASLAGGWEGWIGQRSRAFRKSLFRAQRAAAGAGLAIRELHDVDAELFLALHDARVAQSVFAEEEHRAFVRRVLPALVAQRRMRAFGILDGARVVAIDLCSAGAASLCSWNTGFLPELARFSPGTLLLAEEVWAACAEGMEHFDFGRGDQSYKSSWASERRELVRMRISR